MQNNICSTLKSYFGAFVTSLFSIFTIQDILGAIGIGVSIIFTYLTYKSNKRRNQCLIEDSSRRTKLVQFYLSCKIKSNDYRSPSEAIADVVDIVAESEVEIDVEEHKT